ncbi:MAG: glucose-1-phosphate thymidylyltransferase [Muribaculaceae bacterium]|jgi:UDP-N-acetylglucosamine diphosphorylase/glucosamine-1-phosphate N-acetyltransferase|nr:glucose-1-phosphate thymidylyltransferase [Muribaculaceae bacterium]MBQ2440201.1 glucose-1-phosphate thymidylyltransferase [Muribaculaceae bacterium]MBR5787960.1 glucose-1-phosphate thymidylyltransferase [Muribaculaceae bacterium]
MINVIFYDLPRVHADLLPMTFTRPVADFRIGITTIREKWAMMLPQDCRYGYRTVGFLVKKYKAEEIDDNLFIAGNVVPNPALVEEVLRLEIGEALFKGDDFIAYRGVSPDMHADNYMKKEYNGECLVLHYLFDIFLNNGAVIKQDFEMITKGRTSCALSASNTVIGDPDLVFVEEGAYVEGAFLNTNGGPIYIGKDAQVMEGSCVRGPMALCEHSNINMGSKIYSDTTIGPWSKVGGELNNVVVFGYSNKAHDGFLGNAVIGEWCNIGAGTNASNLKNDYSKIRVWNYPDHTFMRTDLQFCGLIMGDHSKVGINCMFNTATVVGVGVNIHGSGFPRTFIPSFSEGSPVGGFTDVQLKKFFDIANRAMARRGLLLTDLDYEIFEEIYKIADTYK